MTGIQYLRSLHEVCCFQTTERGTGPATNSELGRWLKSRALHINGKPIAPTEEIQFPIVSVVIFPSAKRRRCTLL
jgi:hypothetical protein